MALETFELARLVLVAVLLLGYVPVVVAYRRNGMIWIFSAYTVLVIGAIMLLVGSVRELLSTQFIARLAVALSAVMFFISAHRSEKKINKLEAEAAEKRVKLGGDM